MTTKAAFTDEEWKLVIEGPPTAGLTVLMAGRGGTFRETFELAKVYSEAQQQHGGSELIDELVSHRPKMDRAHSHSYEELRDHTLELLRSEITLLQSKATPEEVDAYKAFVVTVATRVAAAHKEKGSDEPVSETEQAALTAITGALG
jgi:hypothetical protein